MHLSFHITRFESLPSTQQYLQEMATQGDVREGTLVLALSQPEGIGQPGSRWVSEAGRNLTFSFLLKPVFLHPSRQFMLNKMVSLAVLNVLKEMNKIAGRLSVKWPNDVYAGDRKIAGILISNAIMGNRISHAVAGIGLNVNQEHFPADCPNPTSLVLETGMTQDTETVFQSLLAAISGYYTLLATAPLQLDVQYRDSLYRFGATADYLIQGRKVQGKISGVDEYGKLLLTADDGGLLHLDLKEVAFIP